MRGIQIGQVLIEQGVLKTFLMSRRDVQDLTLRFLETGKFSERSSDRSSPPGPSR